MATSIFFNGRLISVPGSYSEVDASGLEQVGLGASGIVAVLATGEGGRPVSSINESKDLIRFTNPEQNRKKFRSGNIREAAAILFEPGRDPDITGGAQEVVAMKINPATQSTAQLSNASGPVLDLTSEDYGAFTGQINVSLAAGSVKGKLITIAFEDQIETADNIGGDNLATLHYNDGATTWDTAAATVSQAGQISVAATRAELGRDGESVTPITSGQPVKVVATAADAGKTIVIYGKAVGGALQREVLTLVNGTVVGTLTWSLVSGAVLSAAAASTVDVQENASGLNILSQFTAAQFQKGAIRGDAMFVLGGSTSSLVLDGAGAHEVLVFGRNAAGALVSEAVTTNGTTPVNLTETTYVRFEAVALLAVPAARTLTLSATAAQTDPTVQTNLQKVSDFFNAKMEPDVAGTDRGFEWVTVTGVLRTPVTDLDQVAVAVNLLPVAGLKGDLAAVVNWINFNSSLVTAAITTSPASKTVPLNTSTPVFLAGGIEGTPTFADWQKALNLLKKIRVNSIVLITGDPAVHSAAVAHCDFMAGIGRSERDCFVGISKLGPGDVPLDQLPTKDEFKAQVVNLNTRHVRACGQTIDRFDTAGERQTMLPYYQAAIAAGMQAGSPIGTSLTFKLGNLLAINQDTSWNPIDDAEEMIQAGALFMEEIEGLGRRWVRNVTTHLSSNNIAFIEGSVNEAVNFAVFNFRTNMEASVGKRGFAGTLNAAKGIAINTLGLLVDTNALTAWRALALELNVDTLDVSVEIAPVIPINFVKNTLHLVTIAQAA